ncbi:hypothetical protein WJX82_004826 [Trebouxia sp. C0006]
MSVLLIQPFVLDQLGSQDKRGLSRLREICSYPVCVQAGSERLVASQQGDYQTAQTQAAQSAQLRSLRTQQRAASRISQAEEAQAGPGIHRKQGPRHDNDFARIASISIAPTQEEMLCTVPPYLPRNQAGTVMHLDSASQAAHLDMQFRLFRHDGLGELFTSITAFKESGGIAAVVPNQQKGHRQMPWPQAVQEGTLQVYTNAHVQDLFIPKRGPGAVFMVSFDDLPSKHSKKPQERVEFWKMTKRLQHGTLVQLWTETPSTETDAAPESFHVKIISCIISERHEHLLASRQHNQRPNIGLRLCEGSEMTSLLSATRCHHLPLAHHIIRLPTTDDMTGSSSSSQAAVPPPAYLQESNAIDLSCLIAPPKRNSASEAALKRVNVLNGVWPEEALVQYTTLDPAQRGAIKANFLRSWP